MFSSRNPMHVLPSHHNTQRTRLQNIKTPTDLVHESNLTCIHIGNINWKVETKEVETYLLHLFSDLPIRTYFIKPKTKKPRDAAKCHGGSVKIQFENTQYANQAMERLSNQYLTHPIGNLRFHLFQNDSLVEENPNTATTRFNPHRSTPKESTLTLEQIVHRKERAEKYARQRAKIAYQTDELIKILEPLNYTSSFVDVLDAPELDWDHAPSVIDPIRGGGLRNKSIRADRKKCQVEAIVHVVSTILSNDHKYDSEKVIVADLGSGAGNLSLPLAWFLQKQNIKVLAVDINPRALERLTERANRIGLEVQTLVQDLDECSAVVSGESNLLSDCEVIASLHACGAASDLAIETAVSRDLPFVISPCCIGKANGVRQSKNTASLVSSQRSSAPVRITYPRSKELETFCAEKSILMEYPFILTAADYSIDKNFNADQLQRGKASKRIVEMDRLKWAEEKGDYYTRVVDIPRLGMYPKRELLLGAKRGTLAAQRISSLKTTSTQLFAKSDDKYEMDSIEESESNGMDASGFANYLLPYALAFALSVVATALFFKFILLG